MKGTTRGSEHKRIRPTFKPGTVFTQKLEPEESRLLQYLIVHWRDAEQPDMVDVAGVVGCEPDDIEPLLKKLAKKRCVLLQGGQAQPLRYPDGRKYWAPAQRMPRPELVQVEDEEEREARRQAKAAAMKKKQKSPSKSKARAPLQRAPWLK